MPFKFAGCHKTLLEAAGAVKNASGEWEGGELTQEGAEIILDKLKRRAERRAVERGKSIKKALEEIGVEDAIKERTAAAHEYRNRILGEFKIRQTWAHVEQFPSDRFKGIQTLMEEVKGVQKGMGNDADTKGRAMGKRHIQRLWERIEQAGGVEEMKRGTLDREIMQELYAMDSAKPPAPGEASGSAKAGELARVIRQSTEELRMEANELGANIGKQDGFGVRQSHGLDEISAGGRSRMGINHLFDKALSYEQARDVWINFHLTRIDVDRTVFDGTDPKVFLEKFFDNTHSGDFGKGTMGKPVDFGAGDAPIKSSLSKRVSVSRVLHYKDANAAFEAAQEFGQKRLIDGLMRDGQSLTRSMALMDTFGPNPDATLEALIEKAIEATKGKDAKQAQFLADAGRKQLKHIYAMANGTWQKPENVSLGRFGSMVKSLVRTARLGGSTITSVPSDIMFTNTALAYRGMGSLQAFSRQLEAGIASLTDSERTAALKSIGVMTDSISGHAMMRFDNGETVGGLMGDFERKYFAVTLLPQWTDKAKQIATDVLATFLGEHTHLTAAQIRASNEGVARMLNRHDISDADWDFLRKSKVDISNHEFIDAKAVDWVKDHKVILPDMLTVGDASIIRNGLKDTPANRARALKDLKNKLLMLYSSSADTAVPTPGGREERQLRLRTSPGTAIGFIVDMFTMLRSFPLAVGNKTIGENFAGRGGSLTKEGLSQWMRDGSGPLAIARMIALTTIAGYIGMTVKDALRGKTPKPFINPDGSMRYRTLIDSMQRGGGLSLTGDFMLSEYDRSYRSFLQASLGPALGNLDPAADIITRAVKGEDYGRQSLRLLIDNVPAANLHLVRPVVEHFVWFELQEMMEPGSLRKMEKSVKESSGQEFFDMPFFGKPGSGR